MLSCGWRLCEHECECSCHTNGSPCFMPCCRACDICEINIKTHFLDVHHKYCHNRELVGAEVKPIEPTEPLQEAFQKMEYRPTVVMQIRNGHGDLLLVQSAQNDLNWDSPQGGIEPGEELLTALFREAKEELGIRRDEFSSLEYCGFEDLDFPPGVDKRGFTKGKRYFFVRCTYLGGDYLEPNKDEVGGYVWVDKSDQEASVRIWVRNNRVERRELTLRHLFPKV